MGTILPNRRTNGKAPNLPRVFFLTEPDRQTDVLRSVSRLPKGWGVIFRHYGIPNRDALAHAVARICRHRGLILLVAGDFPLAAKIGADGLHLPEGLARQGCLAAPLNWVKSHGKILTVSAHSPAALTRAAALGAHAALLSPVFPTQSHVGAKGLGPLHFAQWGRNADLPIIALGGIRPQTLRRLQGSPIEAIALSGGVSLFIREGLRLCWGPKTKGSL